MLASHFRQAAAHWSGCSDAAETAAAELRLAESTRRRSLAGLYQL